MNNYKQNLNWYLFELLKKQYGSIAEDELKIIYQFELTIEEFMTLWAYEIDLAIGKLESLSQSMVDDLRFDSKTKCIFKIADSWRPCFKYIKDYQAHLSDVIYNCSVYHEKGILKPFEYENAWLVNYRDDMYRRLTGENEASPQRKRSHASLISS